MELSFLPSYIYQPLIFSDGPIFSLRVEFNERGKKFWCTALAGGCYDSFLKNTRQINEQMSTPDTSAYGFNFSIENVANLLKNAGGIIGEKFGLRYSVLISSTSQSYTNASQTLASQLRDLSMSVEVWNENAAVSDCLFVS